MAPDPQSPAERFHAQLAAALSSAPDHSTTRPLDHLPLLSPADSHTLTTYLFTHNANLPAAAAALEISPTDLNTFFQLPHIAAHLAYLEAAQAKHDIRAALDTLKHAATTPDFPAEPRRAATAILRFYNAQLRPRALRTTDGTDDNAPRAHSRAKGSAGSAAVPVSTSSTSPRPGTDTAPADRGRLGAPPSATKEEHARGATELALNLGGSKASLAHSRATCSAGSAAVLGPTAATSSRPATDTASRTEDTQSTATDASKSPAPSVLLDPSDLLDLSDPSLPARLAAAQAQLEAKSKQYHDEAQEALRELAYASARRLNIDLSKHDPIATYVFRGKLFLPIINKRINRTRPPPRIWYRIPAS